MAEKKNILIFVNPISGGKDKSTLIQKIKSTLEGNCNYYLVLTTANMDYKAIVTDYINNKNIDVVVAAGGDGTINQVASALKGTGAALCLIPLGSGNGLARYLKIPFKYENALNLIFTGHAIEVDACHINGSDFFCTAGVGFDAHVGFLFAGNKKRGFISYLKIILAEFSKYKAQHYNVIIDGKEYSKSAFLMTFANANQWGNEAIIAPHAKINDGIIEITQVKSFPFWYAPILAFRLYTKSIYKSRFVENFQGRQIEITRKSSGPVHFDGEPTTMETNIKIGINPSNLKVLVPQKFITNNN